MSLVSDHGMLGYSNLFYPNVVLERAGLLARTPDNRIDLSRTQICAPAWGDFFLNVNSTEWKGGIVSAVERDSVIQKAMDALLNAVDPETGRHIVTRVFRSEELSGLGAGGPAGGDLYLDVADGYLPSNVLADRTVRPYAFPAGAGNHGFYSQRRKMQTIWYAAGPGFAHGKTLTNIRQIDIIPTLSHALGIPIPANATGHVIGEAFLD
jgi:predicted AlkP superfamily phosphohydrolase/phosphomutase